MSSGIYEDVLATATSTPGVRGALVVALQDGLVVDGRVHVGVQGDAVAALAASLYKRACSASGDGGCNSVRFVELETDDGRILIAGQKDLALMAVIERRANAGQARLALRRAADELASVAGSA
ncbi:MAG: roadblock/LC7 domain-containing protein [Gemmatimonadales bacterium]